MANAYDILGVPKGASDDEIKQAYRRLAAKHHPDRGGDTAKFQEIQGAYETLTDPVKRQQHDNPNPFQQGFHQTGPGHFEFHFGGGSPEDLFEQFFRGQTPFHTRQARRNKDLRIQLQLNLEDTLVESNRTVSVQTTKGDRFTVDVNIPRGVTSGTTIKYSGLGDNMFDTLTRGDLYVIINVIARADFEINGINLVTTVTIDAIDAMLGCEKTITNIDGKEYVIKIPQACQHDAKFGLAGQGLYHMNTNVRGDLIVVIKVKIPTLDPEQLNILKTIRTT